MAGIFGIALPRKHDEVVSRIGTMRHRGCKSLSVVEGEQATLAESHGAPLGMWLARTNGCGTVFDGALFNWRRLSGRALDVDQAIQDAFDDRGFAFLDELDGPFALAIAHDKGVFIARDPIGIAPLYYGYKDGAMCFASEAKALLGWASSVREFPPGHYCWTDGQFVRFAEEIRMSATCWAGKDPTRALRLALEEAVAKRASLTDSLGCWLSGGIDSSAMAALACLNMPRPKTFAAGVKEAPDLAFARRVASHLDTQHHELDLQPRTLINALPKVIGSLESFDALLVRSSLANYMVGKLASDHVDAVLSGEGGDELFAGYDYLKVIPTSELNGELIDITGRLHNTALQRVDRCSSAHGIKAFVPFLDGEVLKLAFSMGPELKIHRNGGVIDKWALRQSVVSLLPAEVVNRPKAKFWDGAGIEKIMQELAKESVSDSDFASERMMSDGGALNSKEELLYYRIFKERFGELDDLSFVGRTKGAPLEN